MSTATVSDLFRGPVAREFEDLFRQHYRMVYRTAYGITGRAEDAEDVLQTVFLRLLRREDKLDLGPNPAGYLYRAAVNVSLNTVEARNRHILTADAELFESRGGAVPSDLGQEARLRLSDAMAQLKPRAVEILILRYEHEYTDAEIASLLGTSRGVVAVSLYRSRARLKKLLRSSMEKKP
jgi:RNA polymerase sigma-70 factor (ECF subfamily)